MSLSAPAACTIVANNYIAFARVLANSFLEHHPQGRFFTLVVDEPNPMLDYDAEPFETLFAKDLGFDSWPSLAFRYSILELSTAVKPRLLANLLNREQFDQLCYFDPDILILSPLDQLYRRLEACNILLTPHILQPLDDELLPSEQTFLQSGAYNLGFIGISRSRETERFLDWWDHRLRRFCVHEVHNGLFVDQKWADLVPSLFSEVCITRDPCYNVAYWNLQERQVDLSDAVPSINGSPVAFFHFSGLQINDLDRISKYQDRFRLSDVPQLTPLFEDYRGRLLRAGHEKTQKLSYAYDVFDDGSPVPDILRRWFRDPARIQEDDTPQWTDPFALGPESFWEWSLDLDDRLLPRLVSWYWSQNVGLQAAITDPFDTERERMLRWFTDVSASQLGFAGASHERLLAKLAEYLADLAPPSQPSATQSPTRETENPQMTAEVPLPDEDARPLVSLPAMQLHQNRPDLQESFPDPLGVDRQRFAYWIALEGDRGNSLPKDEVRRVRKTLPLRARLSSVLRRRGRGLLGSS